MKKISIDDGSSYIKICHVDNGGQVLNRISSRVIPRAAISGVDGFSSSSYEVNGRKYSVNESASSHEVLKTDDSTYQLSDHNLILIHDTLRKEKISGEIELLVTLPVNQFFNIDGSPNSSRIEEKQKNVMKPITYLNGDELIKISSVSVVPEGLGAFVNIANNEELNDKGNYLLADIGGTTTDCIIFNNGDIIKYTSLNTGSFKVLNKLSQILSAKLDGEALPLDFVLDVFNEKKFQGEDLSALINPIVAEFEEDLNAEIRNFAGAALITFNKVIFSGGGANFINCATVDSHKRGFVTIPSGLTLTFH